VDYRVIETSSDDSRALQAVAAAVKDLARGRTDHFIIMNSTNSQNTSRHKVRPLPKNNSSRKEDRFDKNLECV